MAVKVELDIRAQIANLNKGLDKTQKQLKGLQAQSNKTSKTMQSNMNQTSKVAGDLKSALTGVFAIGTAVALAKSIVNVRAEFQKFEAMLKVALGSAEAANREFAKIQKFAADTPFSVRELTDSFVRLVNQGFKPTQREMRAMGDLAAAMGKEFIQLTEAIIDAQVGEFERLKEFGIRASKQGDEVSLSFKGIQQNVAFTEEAIRDAIVGFGEMEGVMGTMEEVSGTLGGQLSNLGDSLTVLANKLGEMSEEEVSSGIAVIKNLADILGTLTELKSDDSKGVIKILKEVNLRIAQFAPQLRPIQSLKLALESLGIITGEAAEGLAVLVEGEEITEEEVDDTTNAVDEQVRSMATLQKELKLLNEEKKTLSITDTERLGQINRETQAIKDQITEINKLGVALETKALKDEEITIDEDEIFKFQKELDKEDEKRMKQVDKDIADRQKKELDGEVEGRKKAEDDKQLLIQGTGEAAIAGLGLLAEFTKDNAEAQQAIAIAQAIINGALGITKTGATLGYPQAIPFQIAQGLQTLAQIAIIRSQKFEKGGFDVLKGRRHAQGGVSIGFGEEAEDGEGRSIFSRQAMQKYGKFLPAFTKAINDGTVDTTDGDSYAFNFDDSKSVSELKVISALLSRPEVRYENGYRIETRKGQRTKVKV